MKKCLIIGLYISMMMNLIADNTIGKHQQTLMGSAFEVCAIHSDSTIVSRAIKLSVSEIVRIENLISSYKNNTETAKVNSSSGIKPVKVSYEFFSLTERCIKLSKLTDGAFDITFAVTDNLWDFKSEKGSLPSQKAINQSQTLIDYRKIILNRSDTTIFLEKQGMRIGFGAIGKGYAANKAKIIMKKAGIENGYVNASGDILFWGSNNGTPWRVGISSPEKRDEVFGWIEVTDMAVVTSGNYVYHIMSDSTILSHIINPKTARPVTDTRSVTIICPDAELADGLSTSVSVLGPVLGLKLINQLKGVECVIVTSDNRLLLSENVSLLK